MKVSTVKENDNDNIQCRHMYMVGYSFRMPQPFFRNLLCDNCGHRIKLSLPWRVAFWFVNIIGFIFAVGMSTSVHIELFGTTFLVQIFVFLLLISIVQLFARLVLKYGKWIEV